MRHLAIGDIHGCFTALTALADFVPFQFDDHLITLGDYVDRGHFSKDVIDWLIAHRQQGKLIALRGNHEVMMLEARGDKLACENWMWVGGLSTLMSYGDEGDLSQIPQSHWDFLESTRRVYETETHVFVHGNLDPYVPLDAQTDLVYWATFGVPEPHMSGKTMVCGHTAQRTGRPNNVGHAVCIDTWVYGEGWLTCLDADTGQYWQANEKGETRTDSLSDANKK